MIQIMYCDEDSKLCICGTVSAFQEVKKYGNLVNEIQYNSQKVGVSIFNRSYNDAGHIELMTE